MTTLARFAPGSLVRARGREWIVLPGSDGDLLRLRPLSGSEEDSALVHAGLEQGIEPAHFPAPAPRPEAGQESALLLRDALLMSLRRGAGPFRSFGNVQLEPRAYQLVPLLMALRLDPIRLLIADDVGIGKTVEAGLIAREVFDRGEIRRFCVLCPPHLVDQWLQELESRFHFKATPVTAASAARLERGLPVNESIFGVYPHTVVSLDYIKSDRRRLDFVRACPELVIVDEAHTCTNTGRGRHQRYELLKLLTEDSTRHMVLLTATPHSGDESAFFHLLGLLDPAFEQLQNLAGKERDDLRQRLAAHFVQRRRPDIDEWMETRIFPRKEATELTYRLTGEWEDLFDAVLDYAADVTASMGGDERRQRLTFWGTLALMRCVSSSPAAAAQALRTRLQADGDEQSEADLQEQVFDGAADDMPADDVEPGADTGNPVLARLVAQAERLSGEEGDPKLALLFEHVRKLLKDGFSPVIFCRYVATAHYVHQHLTAHLKNTEVQVVTGQSTPVERLERIEAMDETRPCVLVATDCLSEGINLQDYFDAVIHYDLSWNPTRHEQREGRVDRYGQQSEVVRATLIYGENNPVDGAVLQVILRKAESIRRELGVPVPLPDDDHKLTQALMRAVLLRGKESRAQRSLDLDFTASDEAAGLNVVWTDLAEKAKKNRTVFAQRRLKPSEVMPEWNRMQVALGSQHDVERFVRRALSRFNAALEYRGQAAIAPVDSLPDTLRERLAADGIAGSTAIDFHAPPARGCRFVHRSHPLVTALSEELLERALNGADGAADGLALLGRTGAWRTKGVDKVTSVLLLRLRHQLTMTRQSRSTVLLVEEALPVAIVGRNNPNFEIGDGVLARLEAPAEGTLPDAVRTREIESVLASLADLTGQLDSLADEQATKLLEDHRRVREAARAHGQYSVQALKPVDVVAAYVLLPVSVNG
jgi:superfamily II DNA or RNA helicase